MATAPTVLDQAAQQLADKALEKVQEKMAPIVEEAVNKAVTPLMEAQEQKLFAQLNDKSVEKDKKVQATLRSWSRLPKDSPYLPVEKNADLGLRAARIVRAYAAVQGDMEAVPKFIRDTLKDKEVSELAAKGLETGTPSKGGALTMEQHLAGEFYPLLREELALLELGCRVIPMPNGAMSIAGMESGSSVGWVGEAKKGKSTRPVFGRRKLSSKKAYGNVVVSNDLFEESDYSVDEIIRDDLVAALAETLFVGGIHGSGSDYMPLGCDKDPKRTQVAVGALVDADTPTLFIEALMDARIKFDYNNAGWLFGPSVWRQYFNLKTSTGAYHFREEMKGGTLMGYPYKVSTLIEKGTSGHKLTHQFFGKWVELIMGVTRNMQIEMSKEATCKDEEDNEVNAWDEDLSFIKITQKCDTKLRQPKAMAHSNDTWTV